MTGIPKEKFQREEEKKDPKRRYKRRNGNLVDVSNYSDNWTAFRHLYDLYIQKFPTERIFLKFKKEIYNAYETWIESLNNPQKQDWWKSELKQMERYEGGGEGR